MIQIIESNIITLQKGKNLLDKLSNEQLNDNSIAPYFSSIGCHLRHIYDFYDCILRMNENKTIDLTDRKRIAEIESCCDTATNYFESVITSLEKMKTLEDFTVTVIDDLGTGKIKINYTLSGLLAQVNSHTIHHYATINYILTALGIQFEDSDFGYNPTTPRVELSSN